MREVEVSGQSNEGFRGGSLGFDQCLYSHIRQCRVQSTGSMELEAFLERKIPSNVEYAVGEHLGAFL